MAETAQPVGPITNYQLRKLRKASRQLHQIKEARAHYLDRLRSGEPPDAADYLFHQELTRILEKQAVSH